MLSRRSMLLGLACALTASCASPRGGLAPLAQRVRVGAFVQRRGGTPDAPQDVERLESEIGARFDIINDYLDWGAPLSQVRSSLLPRRELMVSWKPSGEAVSAIAQGLEDDYIDGFAAAVRAYWAPVALRLAFEMNGDWNTYSSAGGGPSSQTWVTSWRRVVERVRAAGANNARFVWAPNEMDQPERAGNRLEDYWPGHQHVDVLGFDAYNWSDQEPRRGDGRYRSFEEIVEGPYARLLALPGAGSLPIWLTEFGTTENTAAGCSKQVWFEEMFACRRFPALEAIVYFSQDDTSDTHRDWRLDSSSSSLAGFRTGLSRR